MDLRGILMDHGYSKNEIDHLMEAFGKAVHLDSGCFECFDMKEMNWSQEDVKQFIDVLDEANRKKGATSVTAPTNRSDDGQGGQGGQVERLPVRRKLMF